MRNKKCIAMLATLGLVLCMNSKTNAIRFYDTVGTRYEGAVERLGELKVVNGVSDKTFNFGKTVTRAELAKMIVQIAFSEKEIEKVQEEVKVEEEAKKEENLPLNVLKENIFTKILNKIKFPKMNHVI